MSDDSISSRRPDFTDKNLMIDIDLSRATPYETAQLIEQRDEELVEIERDISDINSIMRDINDLVHQQGEQLDDIDTAVEQTVYHTEVAVEELQQAYTYYKHGVSLTTCIIGLVIGGPVGLACGVKSGIALAGISIGTGVIGYNVPKILFE
jgi:ABC-type dipeptide/oligopeptide/nickel transport system permease component